MDYLPKDATIEQACNWLQAKTGQTWILPRLLECHLTPHFWLDYKAGYPDIFGDRIEGYQAKMIFQGDICRLESDGGDALVNIFTAHDGLLIKIEPGLRVPLSELRFKRDKVERVAEIINYAVPAQNITTPEPLVAVSASRGLEGGKDRLVDKAGIMKKAALIAKHAHQWPTIIRDFQDAIENGLSQAAKAPGHGDWFEASALNWADQRGKLKKKKEEGPANLTNVWPGKKHIIKG
jgi:hypothetical protein